MPHAVRSQRRRRTLGTLVVAALLGAGAWLLIAQAARFERVLDALRQAAPSWLVLGLAGVLAAYLGYALLYQAMASVDSGPRPGLGLALRVSIAVFGTSIVATAAGRLGGEYWTLRRMHESPPQAWARVLALNTAEWAVLAAIAWSGALLALAEVGHGAPLSLELAWLLVPPACAAVALYLTAGRRRRLAEDRGGRARRTLAAALRAIVLLRRTAASSPARRRALAGGLLHWAGDLLVMWVALRAFGTELHYAPLAVAYATGYASTILPLPAGGAGGVEAASTYALTLVGVPLAPALLATLVQRLWTYWVPLAVALASAGWTKRLSRDLAAVPRPARPGRSRQVAVAGAA